MFKPPSLLASQVVPTAVHTATGQPRLLAGTYVFGLGMGQQIELTIEQRQGVSSMYSPLTWARKGTMGRPLVHLGDRAFYPAGAPSVRILFAEDKGSIVMTVSDPELVLTARRKQEPK